MAKKLFELTADRLASITKIYVFGDIHGDYFPFSRYVEKIDLEENLLIFLGDYADRGKYGIETIYTVNSLITQHPHNVIALKGNHEDYQSDGMPVFNPCDLLDEVRHKKGNWQKYFRTTFIPFLEQLYLGVIIPGEILFVHGGISKKIRNLDDIRYPSQAVERDILWSDPVEQNEHYAMQEEFESFRGLGVLFTQQVTEEILKICNVKKIIRSHQPRIARDGIHYSHDNKVLTTNSTSVYDGKPHVLIINPAENFEISTEFI